MMAMIAPVWFAFFSCAVLIAVAGTRLCRYADVIAAKTGMSGSWAGLVLLATVTSLPELATGISAVGLADAPNIAVGDVFGSCAVNLVMLALLELLERRTPFYARASQGHVLSAGFGIILIGLAAAAVQLGERPAVPSIGHLSLLAPLLPLLYLAAMRALYLQERGGTSESAAQALDRYPELGLRRAAAWYAFTALVVIGAGIWLSLTAPRLAVAMGWHTSFVGTLLVAVVTSLPELSVAIAAVRIGAPDIAIANILGSNLFNMVVLAVDDVFFKEGPLFAAAAPVHVATALGAMIMSAMVIVGVACRADARLFRTVGWTSGGLLVTYLGTVYIVFRNGL